VCRLSVVFLYKSLGSKASQRPTKLDLPGRFGYNSQVMK
jgi:hypothetical protein